LTDMTRRFKNVLNIGFNSLAEYLHSKVAAFFFIFAALLIYVSLLLGVMAVDQEKRTLIDFGLAMSELSIFAFAIFWASMTIQKEMDTKTIYLILSRPVRRADYIAGKLLGIYLTTAVVYLAVSAIHLSLLFLKGHSVPGIYFTAVLFSYFKIVIISSIAMLITSFTTSSFSSVLISVMVWILGHFTSEMKYLLDKLAGVKLYALKFFLFLTPNFQLFNVKDVLSSSGGDFLKPALYFVSYVTALYFANVFVFRKKEF